jgi:hypothetical protein
VIGADNQALEFLVANRSSPFTGVTGDLDFEGTISLTRRLQLQILR